MFSSRLFVISSVAASVEIKPDSSPAANVAMSSSPNCEKSFVKIPSILSVIIRITSNTPNSPFLSPATNVSIFIAASPSRLT